MSVRRLIELFAGDWDLQAGVAVVVSTILQLTGESSSFDFINLIEFLSRSISQIFINAFDFFRIQQFNYVYLSYLDFVDLWFTFGPMPSVEVWNLYGFESLRVSELTVNFIGFINELMNTRFSVSVWIPRKQRFINSNYNSIVLNFFYYSCCYIH